MTRHLIKASLFAPLLLGTAILTAAAQDRSSGRMMMKCGPFGMIIMLLVLLFLLLGIAAFIKYLRSK